MNSPHMLWFSNTAPELIPLKQCTATIIWNFLQHPSAPQILNENTSVNDLTRLLRSAIDYQAPRKADQLVAQSLICLRTCAEALRAKASGLLDQKWHRLRKPKSCRVECIANLNMHLKLCTRELSRVFFKKEGLVQRLPWWLSTFYSFCIQSYVRRALIELTKDADHTGNITEDQIAAPEADPPPTQLRPQATTEGSRQFQCTDNLFHHTFEVDENKWASLSNLDKECWLRHLLRMSPSDMKEKLRKVIGVENLDESPQTRFEYRLKRSSLSESKLSDLVTNLQAQKKHERSRLCNISICLCVSSSSCFQTTGRNRTNV